MVYISGEILAVFLPDVYVVYDFPIALAIHFIPGMSNLRLFYFQLNHCKEVESVLLPPFKLKDPPTVDVKSHLLRLAETLPQTDVVFHCPQSKEKSFLPSTEFFISFL